MSRHSKKEHRIDPGVIEVKSKFDAEFRRFSLKKGNNSYSKYEDFHRLLESLHRLPSTPFLISYTDPSDGDLLPINNDDNFTKALQNAKPLLRIVIQRKGESLEALNGYGTVKPRNIISSILGGGTPGKSKSLAISNPHDFRQVSSIIDVDVVPETCRRVRLVKHGSERPLGFYIRDGTSFRVTPDGMLKVPGIFISRLVPGGLAESTGLLAVNDEVLEVNGIEVAGKTLDQVTDMMVANSWNLIITVKPANQRGALPASGPHLVAHPQPPPLSSPPPTSLTPPPSPSVGGGGGKPGTADGDKGGEGRRRKTSKRSQTSREGERDEEERADENEDEEEDDFDRDEVLDHVRPAPNHQQQQQHGGGKKEREEEGEEEEEECPEGGGGEGGGGQSHRVLLQVGVPQVLHL